MLRIEHTNEPVLVVLGCAFFREHNEHVVAPFAIFFHGQCCRWPTAYLAFPLQRERRQTSYLTWKHKEVLLIRQWSIPKPAHCVTFWRHSCDINRFIRLSWLPLITSVALDDKRNKESEASTYLSQLIPFFFRLCQRDAVAKLVAEICPCVPGFLLAMHGCANEHARSTKRRFFPVVLVRAQLTARSILTLLEQKNDLSGSRYSATSLTLTEWMQRRQILVSQEQATHVLRDLLDWNGQSLGSRTASSQCFRQLLSMTSTQRSLKSRWYNLDWKGYDSCFSAPQISSTMQPGA